MVRSAKGTSKIAFWDIPFWRLDCGLEHDEGKLTQKTSSSQTRFEVHNDKMFLTICNVVRTPRQSAIWNKVVWTARECSWVQKQRWRSSWTIVKLDKIHALMEYTSALDTIHTFIFSFWSWGHSQATGRLSMFSQKEYSFPQSATGRRGMVYNILHRQCKNSCWGQIQPARLQSAVALWISRGNFICWLLSHYLHCLENTWVSEFWASFWQVCRP